MREAFYFFVIFFINYSNGYMLFICGDKLLLLLEGVAGRIF